MDRRRYIIRRGLAAMVVFLVVSLAHTVWAQHVDIRVHDPVMIKQDDAGNDWIF